MHDTWRRQAKVYWYSEPLFGTVRNSVRFLVTGNSFDHWGVAVEFEGGKTYIFDGAKSRDGDELVVEVTHGWPDIPPLNLLECKFIAAIECSPSEMFEFARSTVESKTSYSCLNNNCQTWAIRFCEQVVERFATTEKELARRKINDMAEDTAKAVAIELATVTAASTVNPVALVTPAVRRLAAFFTRNYLR